MFKSTWLLLVITLLSGCAINIGAAQPEPPPSCKPGSGDVVVIDAPADIDIPECTETAVDEPALNVGRRQWCCWKANAPSLEELAARH